MIPLRLKLQGLYSYKNLVEIDFGKLTSARIFGIFGSVGSGKSSLLEAVSTALYDEVDRIGRQDDRKYNLMNLQSKEMRIEFEFAAGGKQYLFTYYARRNSRKFRDINHKERNGYCKENGEWVPLFEDKERVTAEKILKLSYSNFKRTMIIPQGKFQEFIQLGRTERLQMLKELFNLNRFDLYRDTSRMGIKTEKELENIKGQRLSLGDISTEKIEESEQRLKSIQNEISMQQSILSQVEEQLKVQNHQKEVFKEKQSLERLLAEEQEKIPAINQRKQNLHLYRYCQEHLKSPFSRLNRLIRNKEQKEDDLKKIITALKAEQIRFDQLRGVLEKCREDHQNRDTYQSKIQAGEKLIKLRDQEARNSVLKTEYRQKEVLWNKNETALETLKHQKEEIHRKQAELPDNSLSSSELAKAQTWFLQAENLKTRQQEAEQQLIQYQNRTKKQRQTINSLVDQAAEPCGLLMMTAEEVLERITLRLKEIEDEETRLSIELQTEKLSIHMSSYRKELKDGIPCPLCGALEHPGIALSAEQTDETANILEQSINRKRREWQELTQLHQKLIKEFETRDQLTAEEKAGMTTLREAERSWENHQNSFFWDYDPEDFDAFRQIHEQGMKVIKAREEDSEKMNSLDRLQRELIEIQTEHSKERSSLQTELIQIKTLIETLTEDIPQKTIDDSKSLSKADIQQHLSRLNQRVESLQTNLEHAEQNYEQANSAVNRLKGSEEAEQAALKQICSELEKEREQLSELISKSPIESLETVQRIITQKLNTEQEEKQLNDFDNHLHTIKTRLEQLDKENNSTPYDEDHYENLITQQSRKSKELAILLENKGNEQALLDSLKDKLDQAAILEKTRERLQKRLENINILKKMFTASGFVNFAATKYLKELCDRANDHFYRLTNQSLRLTLSQENDFVITDLLNGGQIRSIKTLSGGQTFLAAFSLAMALIDSINRGKENFFFIDEGFGSLDKQSLQIVFTTLRSLQKENKIIGIISHVEDLKQEIDTFLQVSTDQQEGSNAKPSWEL